MSEKRAGPVFNAVRDQHIAYAEQGPATLTSNVVNAGESADIAIRAELQALRELLSQLGSSAAPSAALVEAAEKATEASEPDHHKVIGYVESAVKLATTANGFAEQADKLIPRLQQIATWAGQTWDSWRPALGL
jgi:hypothetical protein